MKNLFYILAFTITVSGYSQLFNQTWYLKDIIILNTNNPPPTVALLEFYDNNPFYGISLAMCQDFYSNIIEFNANSTFTVLSISWLSGAGDCNSQFLDPYRLFYYEFYEDNQTTPFEYQITSINDTLELVLTNGNGDQAIYGNVLLNTPEITAPIIKMFPNPATDQLQVIFDNASAKTVTIHSMLGREMVSTTTTNIQYAINVAALDTWHLLFNHTYC